MTITTIRPLIRLRRGIRIQNINLYVKGSGKKSGKGNIGVSPFWDDKIQQEGSHHSPNFEDYFEKKKIHEHAKRYRRTCIQTLERLIGTSIRHLLRSRKKWKANNIKEPLMHKFSTYDTEYSQPLLASTISHFAVSKRKSTEPIIPKAPFQRLVKEIANFSARMSCNGS